MLSSFSRPTAVAVRRALSLFSPVSPLPQNQQNFTISALTKREFLLLFSKSNAFSFFGGAKKESAIAWSHCACLSSRLSAKGGQRSVRTAHRFSRATRKCLDHFLIKNYVGSSRQIFPQKWSSTSARTTSRNYVPSVN